MIIRYFFLIFSAFILLTANSCKRHRMHKKEISQVDSTKIETAKVEITPETPKAEVVVAPEIKTPKIDVKPAEIDFKYLNIKSKVNFTAAGESQSFPVNIHIKKDSIIWLSIVVGLEGARGIITQDSVIFLDRLHRTYYKYDFASLSKQFNYPLNYDLVQSILIGNMPIKKRETDEVTKQDGGFLVKQQEKFVRVENFIDEQSLKLQKLNASDEAGSSKMQIDYSNFLNINTLLMPQDIKAQIDAQQSGKILQTLINLQHNKIELLDQSPGFVFSIPKSYLPK
jgi:Domain of unknown function (DUF4292)